MDESLKIYLGAFWDKAKEPVGYGLAWVLASTWGPVVAQINWGVLTVEDAWPLRILIFILVGFVSVLITGLLLVACAVIHEKISNFMKSVKVEASRRKEDLEREKAKKEAELEAQREQLETQRRLETVATNIGLLTPDISTDSQEYTRAIEEAERVERQEALRDELTSAHEFNPDVYQLTDVASNPFRPTLPDMSESILRKSKEEKLSEAFEVSEKTNRLESI